MKQCIYCGKEQLDEATSCPIDGQPLKTVIARPQTPISPVAPLTFGSSKTLWIGIVAFGLIIWPLILLHSVWAAHQSNVHYVPPDFSAVWFWSWLVGFVVAICGFFVRCEDSTVLKFVGRFLCFVAVSIQAGFILWAITEFQKFRSSAL
jgi:hypothetical protein